jgi:putative membrane protein
MKHLPRLSYLLLLTFLAAVLMRGQGDTTRLLIASSVAMFACCAASAAHLLGVRAALRFIVLGVVLGWIAEELGATRGWFFGHYTYTDVLGPRIGAVPAIIPLMWFALCYVAYVLSNLIVWQSAVDGPGPAGRAVVMALLAAMLVTAYDLGADPYMVYVLKAWIMQDTTGWWFGETVQGFAGWMEVSFTIVLLFRLSLRGRPARPALPVARRHCLVPLALYASNMVFQACLGYPVETRTVAVFAMGIPLLAALCGFSRWKVTS